MSKNLVKFIQEGDYAILRNGLICPIFNKTNKTTGDTRASLILIEYDLIDFSKDRIDREASIPLSDYLPDGTYNSQDITFGMGLAVRSNPNLKDEIMKGKAINPSGFDIVKIVRWQLVNSSRSRIIEKANQEFLNELIKMESSDSEACRKRNYELKKRELLEFYELSEEEQ